LKELATAKGTLEETIKAAMNRLSVLLHRTIKSKGYRNVVNEIGETPATSRPQTRQMWRARKIRRGLDSGVWDA
jgi:hypothetical protein